MKEENFDKQGCLIYVESFDGESFGGATHQEIVEQMRASAWGGDQSAGTKGYMKQVAKRVWDWSHKEIRIGSPKAFLEDMAEANLIKLTVRS